MGGTIKLLTKNGAAYADLIDAKWLEYYHSLEAERAYLILLIEAETGLQEVLAGHRVSSADLLEALS